MEQENKDTFYKNIDEFGQTESFGDLRYYFRVIGNQRVEWDKNKNLPQEIKERVEYFAVKYLV